MKKNFLVLGSKQYGTTIRSVAWVLVLIVLLTIVLSMNASATLIYSDMTDNVDVTESVAGFDDSIFKDYLIATGHVKIEIYNRVSPGSASSSWDNNAIKVSAKGYGRWGGSTKATAEVDLTWLVRGALAYTATVSSSEGTAKINGTTATNGSTRSPEKGYSTSTLSAYTYSEVKNSTTEITISNMIFVPYYQVTFEKSEGGSYGYTYSYTDPTVSSTEVSGSGSAGISQTLPGLNTSKTGKATKYTLTATPADDNWRFDCWEVYSNGEWVKADWSDVGEFTPTADMTVRACFKEDTITTTFKHQSGGTFTVVDPNTEGIIEVTEDKQYSMAQGYEYQLTATPDEDHYLVGWYVDGQVVEPGFYRYSETGNLITAVTESGDVYPVFVGDISVNFAEPEKGLSYTVEASMNGEPVLSSHAVKAGDGTFIARVPEGSTFTLSASGSSTMAFNGWTVDHVALSQSDVYTGVLEEGVTVRAEGFAVSGDGAYKVGSTRYQQWDEAMKAAASSGETVVLVENVRLPATLAANGLNTDGEYVKKGSDGVLEYSMPANTWFVIPFESGTEQPSTNTSKDYHAVTRWEGDTSGFPMNACTAADVGESVYLEMTVPTGARVKVGDKSLLAVGGMLGRTAQTIKSYSLYNNETKISTSYQVTHSNIHLEDGAEIAVASGGELTVCGFVYGDGSVTTESGAAIYQPFVIQDFAGGGYTVGTARNIAEIEWLVSQTIHTDNMAFPSDEKANSPFYRYSMNNIQTDLNVVYNAPVYGYVNLYANASNNQTLITVVGTSASSSLLALSAGADMTVTYDPDTYVAAIPTVGRTRMEINGGATFGHLTLDIKVSAITATVDCAEVSFPLPYNFDIVLDKGSYSIPNALSILPGASMTVGQEATLTVAKKLTVYDGLMDYTSSAVDAGETTTPKKVVLSVSGLPNYFADYTDYTKVGKRSDAYPTSAQLQETCFGGSGSADFTVNGRLVLASNSAFGGIVQTAGSGTIEVKDNVTLESTTQVGGLGSYYISANLVVLKMEKAFSFAGATVRTLKAEVLDAGTGRRTQMIAGQTYHGSSGVDSISEYQYDLYYVSTDATKYDTRTEKINAVLDGSWYNHTANVYLVGDDGAVKNPNNPRVMHFAHNADVSDLGYFTDNACTTPVDNITIDYPAERPLYCNKIEASIERGGKDIYYPTLRNAVQDAQTSETVRVEKDLTITSGVAIDNQIELNVNGKTISYTNTPFLNAGTLTLDLNGGSITNKTQITEKDESGNETTTDVYADAPAVINYGKMTMDLQGGTIVYEYPTGVAFATQAVLNTGTLTIKDTVSGGSIVGSGVATSGISSPGATENYAAAVRNKGSDAVLAVENATVVQNQNTNSNYYSVGIVNHNGARITSLTNASISCPNGYAIFNLGGKIDEINGGTITGRWGIYNWNIRAGSQTSGGYYVTQEAVISSIIDANITATYQYAINNRGIVGTIGGSSHLKAPNRTIYNERAWYYDSYCPIKITTTEGLVTTNVYKHETEVFPTIQEITDDVLVEATGERGIENYGDIESITGNAVIAAGTNSNYGILNYGKISTITGRVTISAKNYALGNWDSGRVIEYVETITYLNSDKKQYTNTREYTYDCPYIGTIGGEGSSVNIQATNGTDGLRNRGKIDIIGAGTTISSTSSALRNGDVGYYLTQKKVNASPGDGDKEVAFTKGQPTIGTIDGATIKASSYAINNYGKIGTIQNSTITSTGERAINNINVVETAKDYVFTYEWNDSQSKYVYSATSYAVARTAPLITLIGEKNAISGTTKVVINSGRIETIAGGGTVDTRTTITASSGVGLYNYQGVNLKADSSDGTTNTVTYSNPTSASIGTVKNVQITGKTYAIQNGDGDAAYPEVTIAELGEGLIATAANTDGYGVYVADSNAVIRLISGGDYKSGNTTDASRTFAIRNPDMQTYPTSKKLTPQGTTRSVTFTDGTTVRGYYYIGLANPGTETVTGETATDRGDRVGYATLAEAIAAYEAMSDEVRQKTYITLVNTTTETGNIKASKDLYLDLNGCTVNLNGYSLDLDGNTLYGMDARTNGYLSNNETPGKIVGTIKGTVSVVYNNENIGANANKSYVTVTTTDGNTEFHRFAITPIACRFYLNGNKNHAHLAFKAALQGDDTVIDQIMDLGFAINDEPLWYGKKVSFANIEPDTELASYKTISLVAVDYDGIAGFGTEYTVTAMAAFGAKKDNGAYPAEVTITSGKANPVSLQQALNDYLVGTKNETITEEKAGDREKIIEFFKNNNISLPAGS